MSSDILLVDGRAFSWKHLCTLRRAQMEAEWAARMTQPPMFELTEDHRPFAERTAAGRYQEPLLPLPLPE
jgi:hypothetical protein